VEITSFIVHHPNSWNETKEHARNIQESASQKLSEEVFQNAQQRGQEMVLEDVMAAIKGTA
jgi:hypothetical protein